MAGEAGSAASAGTAGSAGSAAGSGGSSAGESGSAGAAGEGEGGSGGTAGDGSAGSAGEGEAGSAGEGEAGSAGEGTAGSNGTAGSDGESGSAGASAGGATGSGGIEQCVSGILCGDEGACCASGDECISGTCMAACESSVRCGTSNGCCDVGQVCVAEMCTTPGKVCIDYSDCEEDEFCEPILGKCLPQQGEPVCVFKPPVGPLAPKLEWSWTGSPIFPTYNQIMDTPLVADLDVDGEPDVVIVSFSGGTGYLRALAGRTGAEKWGASAGVYAPGNQVRAASTPALGDIDGDGKIDIVAFQASGGLIAFNGDGSLKWKSTNTNGLTPYNPLFGESTMSIADLDGDGSPEIIAGGVVFESTGKLRFDNGVYTGANQSTYGAVSIVADVDGDGKQELLSGRRAYRHDGSLLWDNGLVDGYPAIADLDLDGVPELVVIANGKARVQNAKTGALLAETALPGMGAGGPPTVAQFDGVGGPEFASANGTAYSVLHYDSQPTPSIKVVWSKPTQDMSSNRTGSTVFDFEGDGIAEVLYNDECYLRVYDGPTGNVLFQEPNSSNTSHEYPVVADLYGDNHTKLIVVANDFVNNCPAYNGKPGRHGVFVYGDTNNRWVRTRRIWNQHSYHVTNVKSDGSIPAQEPISWGPQGFNNYRQSTQGKAVFNAPDLVVSLEAVLNQCPSLLRLRAHVKNAGSLGVADGIPVAFYRGTAPNGTFLGDAVTPKSLLPGESVDVEWLVDLGGQGEANVQYYVTVDGQSVKLVDECIDTNNTGAIGGVDCGKF